MPARDDPGALAAARRRRRPLGAAARTAAAKPAVVRIPSRCSSHDAAQHAVEAGAAEAALERAQRARAADVARRAQ